MLTPEMAIELMLKMYHLVADLVEEKRDTQIDLRNSSLAISFCDFIKAE